MKKALGKGLSALIPDKYVNQENESTYEDRLNSDGTTQEQKILQGVTSIPISQIISNIDQPRKAFSPEGIDELAASIKEKGILQPVIVKKLGEGQYMLVCGERRFRAARLCGLETIPVVVKDVAGEDLLEWALIENIQREDLNAIEEAQAYQRLLEERMISQDQVAKRVGKDRSTIANSVRLLRLPQEIQDYIMDDRISSGHARAILGLMTPEHQRQMARRIVEENLSVRQVEAIVNRSNVQKRRAKKARHLAAEIIDLENRLAHHLGTQVKIYPRKNQKEGRIEVHYYSLDDLDRILEKVNLPKN